MGSNITPPSRSISMLVAVLSETTIISVRGRQRCMIGRAAARPNLRSGHRHAWRPGRQVHQPSRACQSASAWDRHLDAVRGLYNSLWVPGQFLSGAEVAGGQADVATA